MPFLYGGATCAALDAIQKCYFLREGLSNLPTVLLGVVCRSVLSYDDELSFAVLGWEMHSFFFFFFPASCCSVSNAVFGLW